MMIIQGFLSHFSLSHRPVRGLSSGLFNIAGGEEVLPSKEEPDAGSVRASLLPTSQKP
jgi:hypothetical protein